MFIYYDHNCPHANDCCRLYQLQFDRQSGYRVMSVECMECEWVGVTPGPPQNKNGKNGVWDPDLVSTDKKYQEIIYNFPPF
jgi:hypothetical protein